VLPPVLTGIILYQLVLPILPATYAIGPQNMPLPFVLLRFSSGTIFAEVRPIPVRSVIRISFGGVLRAYLCQ